MLVANKFIESIKYSKDDPAEYGINLDLIQKNYADHSQAYLPNRFL